MKDIIYRIANKDDIIKVKDILEKCSLPFEDIDEHIDNYFISMVNEYLIGVIGIEIYDDISLLRSFAVQKNTGILE